MSNAAALTDDNARLRVIDALKAVSGPVTVADVVARTGLAPYQAEEQLNQIVREYESDLDVDDDGNLIYRFEPGLPGREDIVKKDAARRRKAAFKQGLIAFFKAWTVAMVIVYFIIYVALIIAALVAASRAGGDSRRSTRSFGGGAGGMWLWMGGSPWGYGGYGSYSSRRVRRRRNADIEKRLRAGEDPYSLNEAEDPKKKPSLVERTWYYLFGTKGIKKNPLEQEKELLTYIRAKKGFISNADIIALLGVPYDEADKIGTRLVATYEGEMDLTDEGLAVYRFPNLMLTGAPEVASQTADLGYLWQVRKKEQALRDNPAVAIPILNFINIILAFVVAFYALPVLDITGLGAQIGLFAFPLVFSLLFFGLGTMRKLREAREKGRYIRDSIRISLFKVLFTRRTAIRIPGDERAISAAGLGTWTASEIAQVAEEVAVELRGTVERDAQGMRIRCDRVIGEMAACERLRRQAVSTNKVGRTVFSTRTGVDAPAGGGGAGSASSGDADLAAEIAALEAELK